MVIISSPRPYLKVTLSASTQRGMEEHLLVLDVDALDRPDPLGEVEHLGLGEGGRVKKPASTSNSPSAPTARSRSHTTAG